MPYTIPSIQARVLFEKPERRVASIADARANPFAVALAVRYLRLFQHGMASSSSAKSTFLFKMMPSYEDVLIRAEEKLAPFRYRLGKRRSAIQPRRNMS
jgi:hypothetical protein